MSNLAHPLVGGVAGLMRTQNNSLNSNNDSLLSLALWDSMVQRSKHTPQGSGTPPPTFIVRAMVYISPQAAAVPDEGGRLPLPLVAGCASSAAIAG
jgi:hypothetical protein